MTMMTTTTMDMATMTTTNGIILAIVKNMMINPILLETEATVIKDAKVNIKKTIIHTIEAVEGIIITIAVMMTEVVKTVEAIVKMTLIIMA